MDIDVAVAEKCEDCENKQFIIDALTEEVEGLRLAVKDKEERLADSENMLDIRVKQLAELRKALDL